MQISVLVQRVKGNGYRARGKEPFAVSATGATRKEALAKLRAKIEARRVAGAGVRSAIASCPSPSPGRTLDHGRCSRGLAYDGANVPRVRQPRPPCRSWLETPPQGGIRRHV